MGITVALLHLKHASVYSLHLTTFDHKREYLNSLKCQLIAANLQSGAGLPLLSSFGENTVSVFAPKQKRCGLKCVGF